MYCSVRAGADIGVDFSMHTMGLLLRSTASATTTSRLLDLWATMESIFTNFLCHRWSKGTGMRLMCQFKESQISHPPQGGDEEQVKKTHTHHLNMTAAYNENEWKK